MKRRSYYGKENPNYKHGKSYTIDERGMRKRTRTYQSWADMKDRCLRKGNYAYKNYGARGITVCDRWLNFKNFLEDMGERKEGESIERIDNSIGYTPDNCIWAKRSTQNINRRMQKNNKSGFEGVYWSNSYNKWIARVQKNGKRKQLGRFNCKIEAAKAREKEFTNLYGKHSNNWEKLKES